IETPGTTWRCTPVENSQLYPREPHPSRTAGSYVVAGIGDPKFEGASGPHSPFAAGFTRSHCGVKSSLMPRPARSFHERLAVLAIVPPPFWPIGGANGPVRPATYLLRLALIAVLPSRARSNAAPNRGVMSFQRRSVVSCSVRSGLGTFCAGPLCCTHYVLELLM